MSIIAEDRKDTWRHFNISSAPSFVFVANGIPQSQHTGSLSVSRIKRYWQKISW